MALQPRRCSKSLPYTSFVSVAAYRTDVFSVDYWAGRSPNETWKSVSNDFLPAAVQGVAREGVLHVAEFVDRLEAGLMTDCVRRKDLGLGDRRPKKLNEMSQPTLRVYFRTILLDRLLWAFKYSGGLVNLKVSKRPDLPETDQPKATGGAKAIVGLTPAQMSDIVRETLVDSTRLEEGDAGEWAETVKQFGITSSSGVQEGSSTDSEQKWALEELIGASSAFGHSVRFQSISRLYQRCSNVAYLAASLHLLCGEAGKDPWMHFDQATRRLNSPQSGALRAVTAPYNKSVMPANRTATMLAPAFTALSHSPLFALNKEVRLLDLAGFASNALRWGSFLVMMQQQPSSLNSLHLLGEAIIWRAVAGYMSFTVDTVLTSIPRPPSGDENLQVSHFIRAEEAAEVTERAKNISCITPVMSLAMSTELQEAMKDPIQVTVTEVRWKHSEELPYGSLVSVCRPPPPPEQANQRRIKNKMTTAYGLQLSQEAEEAEIDQGMLSSLSSETHLTAGQSDADDARIDARGSVSLEDEAMDGSTASRSETPKRPHAELDSPGEQENRLPAQSPQKRSKTMQGAPASRELRPRTGKLNAVDKRPQLIAEKSKQAAGASKARAQQKKPSPASKSRSAESLTDKNRIEPQSTSPLYRSTSYAPSQPKSEYMDWVSIAETFPSSDEVGSKLAHPECFTEDEFTLNVMLTENGALQQLPRKYKVNWPEGMECDRNTFKSTMEKSVPPTVHKGTLSHPLDFEAMLRDPQLLAGDVFPSRLIETIMSPDAPLKWVDTICRLFASRTILVPNPERSAMPESWDRKRTLSARDLSKRYQLQVDFQRQVHKLTARDEDEPDAHMCKSSIAEVLADDTKRGYNFLDIPSPGSNHMPSFLIPVALDSLAGQLPMVEGYPQYSTRWHLLATSPALSRAHIDAAKFATWLKVLRGAKIWAILQGPTPTGPLADIEVSEHVWKVFLVEEGDILVMPPGEVHLVLNVEDCFATGGHFYGLHSFRQSFAAGVREHTTGAADTNTEHVGAEFILHNLVRGYHKLISSGKPVPLEGSKEYDNILEDWPPSEQMAALLVMAAHPRYFEPQRVKANQPFTCSTDLLDLRQKTRHMVSDILDFFPQIGPSILELESKIKLYEVGDAKDPPLKSLVSRSFREKSQDPSEISDLGEEE